MSSVLSVQQVNSYIKNMIASDFLLSNLQVQGEVSNCKYHSSGHIYFTLKDEKAAVGCVMFAGNRGGLNFSMKDGDKVVVTGRVDVYEKTGACQLYARKISLAGAGELYEKFLALKAQLEEMGMFAEEYKKPIPKHAKKVGVVTAPTGAAIQDIQNIISRRNPGVQIILYPALVQGENAKESIVKGLRAMDKAGVDVIIVGRGGGSIEDLWAFNEEVVARAIFECETPVISAVGHETDFTIADFVSDLRAPTPSAAAELATEDIFETIEKINAYEKRLTLAMQGTLDNIRNRNVYERRMSLAMKQAVNTARNKVLRYSGKVEAYRPERVIQGYREKLEKYSSLMTASSKRIIQDKKYRVTTLSGQLKTSSERLLLKEKHRLSEAAARLDGLSPLKRLDAGFSYVSIDRVGVKSVSQIKPGDEINVALKDGDVSALVKNIDKRGIMK